MKRYFLLFLYASLFISLGAGTISSTLAGQASSTSKENQDIIFWESVKDTNNIDMLSAYLKNYPNGAFTKSAKLQIENLKEEAQKGAPAATAPDSASSNDASSQGAQRLLRSTPKQLEEDEIKKMVKKHNFCDWNRNYNADFKNNFMDNQDGTVTDRATGLAEKWFMAEKKSQEGRSVHRRSESQKICRKIQLEDSYSRGTGVSDRKQTRRPEWILH